MTIIWFCQYSLSFLTSKLPFQLVNYNDHPATWIYYLAEAIKKQEHINLHIVSMSSYINEDLVLNDKNAHYHIISNKPPRSKNGLLNKFLAVGRCYHRNVLKRRTLKLVAEINPNLITIHGTEHIFGQWLTDKPKTPLVYWMQGVMNFAYRDQDNKAARVLKKQELSIFRKQKIYISKKGNMESFIRQSNSQAVFYNIFYPVSSQCFELGLSRPAQEFDFIFVGSLIKRKGIEDFIEALGQIRKKNKAFRAVIVGGAPEEQYLNRLLSLSKEFDLNENLRFTGMLPAHDQVIEYISRSRILVLPTYADTAPVVIAESQACKTCVIAYNVDGVPGMIEHEKTGVLVELGNVKQLASSMIELFNNPEKQQLIARKAKEFAFRTFHPDTVAKKTIELYNTIIKQ